ncbi:MAG: hypothetical protein ABSC47_13730 [Terracidiphilus sp.]
MPPPRSPLRRILTITIITTTTITIITPRTKLDAQAAPGPGRSPYLLAA